jgi:integrase
MSRRGSLIHQAENELKSKIAFGESRYNDKIADRKNGTKITAGKIYSINTFLTYMKQASYLLKYVKAHHPECKTLQQARKYADEFLQYNINRGLSAYTLKTQVAALSKLYGDSAADYIETPKRSQKDITRSRGEAARDKNFSAENNKALVAVAESTGLRKAELAKIKGTDLFKKNGRYFLNVTKGTKGGRNRIAEIYHPDTEKLNLAISSFKNADHNKVFDHIHSCYDVHNARSIYARNLYQKYAENIAISKLKKQEKYYSRTYHQVYVRRVMKYVSKCLGHSRESVLIHYFR